MINLETEQQSQFSATLRLHFDYIRKVLNYPSNRLPCILAKEIIRKNCLWGNAWSSLCEQNQIDIEYMDQQPLEVKHCLILNIVKQNEINNFKNDARNSRFHDLYPLLNFDIPSKLVNDFQSDACSLIIKARSGLLNLNAKAFKNNTDGRCNICNLDAVENTNHFIGICPIFKNIRKFYFNKETLNINEVVEILNGKDYFVLYKYLLDALKYRNLIVNEFY